MNAYEKDTELLEAIVKFQEEITNQRLKDVPNNAVIRCCQLNIQNLRKERSGLKPLPALGRKESR
jgi:hypothetical protein